MKLTHSIAPLVVATVADGGEAGTSAAVLRSVWLRIPSVKLLAHLAISGSPDPEWAGIGFAAASTWQLTPHVQAAEAMSSRPSPLANVFRQSDGNDVPQKLPGGYEICSAVRLWRARLTLIPAEFSYVDDAGDIYAQTGYGRIVASCTLEPAPEACLSPAEFAELAGQCDLWMDGLPAELLL